MGLRNIGAECSGSPQKRPSGRPRSPILDIMSRNRRGSALVRPPVTGRVEWTTARDLAIPDRLASAGPGGGVPARAIGNIVPQRSVAQRLLGQPQPGAQAPPRRYYLSIDSCAAWACASLSVVGSNPCYQALTGLMTLRWSRISVAIKWRCAVRVISAAWPAAGGARAGHGGADRAVIDGAGEVGLDVAVIECGDQAEHAERVDGHQDGISGW